MSRRHTHGFPSTICSNPSGQSDLPVDHSLLNAAVFRASARAARQPGRAALVDGNPRERMDSLPPSAQGSGFRSVQLEMQEELLYRKMQWFRVGLGFEVHSLLSHSTLGSGVTKMKKEVKGSGFRVRGSGFNPKVRG